MAHVVKNPPANAEDRRHQFDSWVRKIPGGGNGNPLQYSFLGNSMDGGALTGYSPWGPKELDTTEHACMHLLLFLMASRLARLVPIMDARALTQPNEE